MALAKDLIDLRDVTAQDLSDVLAVAQYVKARHRAGVHDTPSMASIWRCTLKNHRCAPASALKWV